MNAAVSGAVVAQRPTNWIPLKHAADVLGVRYETIRRLVQQKHIQRQVFAGRFFVTREDLAAFAREVGKPLALSGRAVSVGGDTNE